jgi:6-phosphogluconolactonase
VYLRVDATGAFLLMSSYNENTVRVHAIAGDGSVMAGAVDTESTGVNPHSIMTDPSNEWAFVPLTNNNPDVVLQFDFDPATGALTPNGQADAATNSGPRHSIFHPTAPYYYVVNEHDDTVALYTFDAATGTVGATIGYSTLPSGFNGANNTCADIHITPDGLYLYASNRGHDSLAMFAVNPGDGTLTSLGQAATEATPREFEIALGRYVYAAGQSSGMLAAYAIDTGMLTPIGTYPVGGGPEWVTAASLPR